MAPGSFPQAASAVGAVQKLAATLKTTKPTKKGIPNSINPKKRSTQAAMLRKIKQLFDEIDGDGNDELELDEFTGEKAWHIYHTIEDGGNIFFIKGNKRIQIVTDEKIYFYLIDLETYEVTSRNCLQSKLYQSGQCIT